MLEEVLMLGVAIVASIFMVPWLAFALAGLFEGFPRLRLRQVLGMVGASAWVLGFIVSLESNGEGTGYLLLITVVAGLLAFAGMWAREFRLLMLRGADEFPDRSDKLAWIFVLTAMAPAGVWVFRSYRKARWPGTAATAPHPLDAAEPFDHTPAMDRIGA
jgi:hypothetical protein